MSEEEKHRENHTKEEYTQLNIKGEPIKGLPKVRTSDGYITEFDRQRIVEQLKKETKLTQKIFDTESISEELAQEIAKETENRIRKLNVKQLSGPLIREIVNNILLEHNQNGETQDQKARLYRNTSTRVGTPVFDAFNMDIGGGFESNENANLIGNPETSHKKKADKISKEQYLLTMPTEQADAHLNGDLHIHDLEYFATRPFCMDWDLRYFLYYGLMPDGSGKKSSVAGPSKKPEVAILHAVKALGSAQTNWAGGQGFYNFLTFLAPYMENKSYSEIKQLMQMFVYEMTQMMVARGGQLVFSSVQLTPGVPELWKDKPIVKHGQIGPNTYGSYEKEVKQMFKALMEVMIDGDYWGKPFNFPKPEINIKKEFLDPEYKEQWDLAYELAAKHGTPYFDNEIPEYRGGDEGVSCYQCLAPTEKITIKQRKTQKNEIKQIKIQELFQEAKENNETKTDSVGTEFAPIKETKTISLNKKQEIETKPFKGIMKKQHKGKLLKITLENQKTIKTTPNHPVLRYNQGILKKITAKKLKPGDKLPVTQTKETNQKEIQQKGIKQKTTNPHQIPTNQIKETDSLTKKKVLDIEPKKYQGPVYDLVEVKQNHNFANSDGIITGNCCAYQFSANEETDSNFEEKLYFEDGHHFTMGGWQVITLNCPRAAYRANGDDDKLFRELKNQMDMAVEIFKTKKQWMNLMQQKNRLPFATQKPKDPQTGDPGKPAADLTQLVWTIGVLGINDMIRYHTGQQLHESKDATKLAIRTMAEMENYSRQLEKQHNMDIALARTPAESTVQRFAVSDSLNNKFRDKAKQVVRGDYQKAKHQLKNKNNRDIPIYYTNGTHVPVDADISLGKRINIEHKFFPIVDGGNIMHIWLGESSPNPQGMKSLTEKIAKNTQTGYFAYTKDMTICNQDYNVTSGLKNQCPSCGSQNIEHISRVTGYLQAVSGWNQAKKQELKDRKKYNQNQINTQ